MTDSVVSAAPRPRLRMRPSGWTTVVGANLAGGLPLVLGAGYIQWWFIELRGGVPPYHSDPDFIRFLGQASLTLLVVGFVAGNAFLSAVVPGWRWWAWLVAAASAALPALLFLGHHELTYGP